MKAVHGERNLCRSSVVEWRKRFLEGRELLEDDARHGQAHRVISPEMIAKMNALLLPSGRRRMIPAPPLLKEQYRQRSRRILCLGGYDGGWCS
ncbi:hypothetical protein TNCV_1060061 [Trichonephila clavipes]|nr:hypothetical protein TNCV_1060061 [Trichonephila clavipes]